MEKLLNLIKLAKMQRAPYKVERYDTHWSWTIPIGKDHTAEIVMSDEAYNALIDSQQESMVE
jgi:hypothetical protein